MFQPPEPVDKSQEHYDATKHPRECIQWDNLLGRGIVGSEDCLYLNIFTNRVKFKIFYCFTALYKILA